MTFVVFLFKKISARKSRFVAPSFGFSAKMPFSASFRHRSILDSSYLLSMLYLPHQLMRKKITVLLFKSQVPSWVRVVIQFWPCSSLGKTSLSAVLCWFFCYLAFTFFFQWRGFMGMKLKLDICFQGVHHSQHWSTLKARWTSVAVCMPFVVGDTHQKVLMEAPFV